MVFNEVFDTQTVGIAPREKIDLISKELTALEEIYNKLEMDSIQNPSDAQFLLYRVEQLYFAYQNVINELNYDIMETLKDSPNTKEFFNLIFKDLTKESKEEKLIRWTNFKAKRSGELADTIIDVVPLLAKVVSINALIQSIFLRATQKLGNYIIGKREIAPLVIENRDSPNEATKNAPISSDDVRREAEKAFYDLGYTDKATGLKAVFLAEEYGIGRKDDIIASGVVTEESYKVFKAQYRKRKHLKLKLLGGLPIQEGEIGLTPVKNDVNLTSREDEKEGDLSVATPGS